MRQVYLLLLCAACVLTACREAQELPAPLGDGGLGPIGDGAYNGDAVGATCPARGCPNGFIGLSQGDAGCTCFRDCRLQDPLPRCVGWELCVQLSAASTLLDGGACIPGQAPNAPCSPDPCAELLTCASIAQRDAGNTCRYRCDHELEAGVADVVGADLIPTPDYCPPGQKCHRMRNDGGVCFPP